jgi:hypothetical protein
MTPFVLRLARHFSLQSFAFARGGTVGGPWLVNKRLERGPRAGHGVIRVAQAQARQLIVIIIIIIIIIIEKEEA